MSWMPVFPPPPPAVVYPHTDSTRPTHDYKPGSFGPVFIVLAAITALSMAACLIGCLCAARATRRSASSSIHRHKDGQDPRGEPANGVGVAEGYKEEQHGAASNGERRDGDGGGGGGGGEIKEEGQTGVAPDHSREAVV